MKKTPVVSFAVVALLAGFTAGCANSATPTIPQAYASRPTTVHTFAIVAATADQTKLSNEQFETARNKLVLALAANGQVLVSDPAEAEFVIEIGAPEAAGVPVIAMKQNPFVRPSQTATTYAATGGFTPVPTSSYSSYSSTAWNGYGSFDPVTTDYYSGGYVTPISTTTPPAVVVVQPPPPTHGHPPYNGNPPDKDKDKDHDGHRNWPTDPSQPPLPVGTEPPQRHHPPVYTGGDDPNRHIPTPPPSNGTPAPDPGHHRWGGRSDDNGSGGSSYTPPTNSNVTYTPPVSSSPSYSSPSSYTPPTPTYSPPPSDSSSSSSSSSSNSGMSSSPPPPPPPSSRDSMIDVRTQPN